MGRLLAFSPCCFLSLPHCKTKNYRNLKFFLIIIIFVIYHQVNSTNQYYCLLVKKWVTYWDLIGVGWGWAVWPQHLTHPRGVHHNTHVGMHFLFIPTTASSALCLPTCQNMRNFAWEAATWKPRVAMRRKLWITHLRIQRKWQDSQDFLGAGFCNRSFARKMDSSGSSFVC